MGLPDYISINLLLLESHNPKLIITIGEPNVILLLRLFNIIVINNFKKEIKKLILIQLKAPVLEGNIHIYPDALCGSAFLNKNFDTKNSYIITILEDSPLLCENIPKISSSMYSIDNKSYNNCLIIIIIIYSRLCQ